MDWNKLKGTFEARKVNNGESLVEVRTRARRFMKELLDQYGDSNKKVLIVSHGAFLKVLIGDLLNMSLKDSIFGIKINHCSPIRISFKDQIFEDKTHKNLPTLSL